MLELSKKPIVLTSLILTGSLDLNVHFLFSSDYMFLLMTQGDKARVIQTLLFVAGIKTLLQTLFGTRLPAIVGGSFAYVVPIAYIINDSSLQRIDEPHLVCTYSFLLLFSCIMGHRI